MNLHEKLNQVKASIGSFDKDKKSFNYSYVSGSQVLHKIRDEMEGLGILLLPEVVNVIDPKRESTRKVDKQGREYEDVQWLVSGRMFYTFVNCEDPMDRLELEWFFTGQQNDPSKAFGSGLTYSERYFLLKFFNIATDAEDPDARKEVRPTDTRPWLATGQMQQLISRFVNEGDLEVLTKAEKAFKINKAFKQQFEDLKIGRHESQTQDVDNPTLFDKTLEG